MESLRSNQLFRKMQINKLAQLRALSVSSNSSNPSDRFQAARRLFIDTRTFKEKQLDAIS